MRFNYLDLIVILIFLGCCISGYAKGLIYTAFNLGGIIIALICARYFSSPLVKYLNENTSLLNNTKSSISKNISNSDTNTIGILKIISNNNVRLEDSMSNLFVNALCFFIIFVLVIIIVKFIRNVLKAIINKTPVKYIDRLAGLLIGFIKASIIVFILFALLTPMLGIIPKNNKVATTVKESYFAKYFYQYNLVTPIIEKVNQIHVGNNININK